MGKKRLFKKYPHLHTFYQEAGEEQLMKKIEEQVYTTSYQIDYGNKGFIAQNDYDELIGIAETLREKRSKVCNAELHGDEGSRLANNCAAPRMEVCTCEDKNAVVKVAMKPRTKRPRVLREKKKSQGAEQTSFKGAGKAPDKVKFTSEYKDTIERLGNIIIKQKLHDKKLEYATF